MPPRLLEHTFDLDDSPEWISSPARYECLHDLWLHNGITFGVEFELSPPNFDPEEYYDWGPWAWALTKRLRPRVLASDPGYDPCDAGYTPIAAGCQAR